MANKVTGWEGSGTRPGSRRRPKGKGTVYWIDLSEHKDMLFEEFARTHGMEKREAAKALMAIAMGLLPPFFWESAEDGGFTGPERTNLIRQIFPKGSGHTNRAPHPVWKTTHDSGRHPETKGMPGGISWMGLLMEKEKERLKRIANRQDVLGRPGGELDEEEARERAEKAANDLKLAEANWRAFRIERGWIEPGDAEDLGFTKPVVIDRIRPTGADVNPYERERQKNAPEILASRQRAREAEDFIEHDPDSLRNRRKKNMQKARSVAMVNREKRLREQGWIRRGEETDSSAAGSADGFVNRYGNDASDSQDGFTDTTDDWELDDNE